MFCLYLIKAARKSCELQMMNITSVAGKLLDGILIDRIYQYLERQRLIRDSQHGSVHGKAYLINLIEFIEEVSKTIDEGNAENV